MEASGRNALDLDLGNIRPLEAEAVGKLVARHRKVRAAGGQLRLLHVDGPVYEVFQVTKLDALLDIRQKAAG